MNDFAGRSLKAREYRRSETRALRKSKIGPDLSSVDMTDGGAAALAAALGRIPISFSRTSTRPVAETIIIATDDRVIITD
jgi:hypothetical protein